MQPRSFVQDRARTTFIFAALLACAACGSDSGATGTASSSAASTRAPAAGQGPAAPASGALVFTAQHGWFAERPLNATRLAQYILPRTGQDTEDAALVVSFFQGQGGSRESNLERWAGQFEQPDGRKSSDVIESAERAVHGMRVFEVALSGTYVAETAPGSGEHYRKQGWRMLAAIVDAPLGPHYVKLTGPEATVRHWESSYRAFISGLEARP